ncbi:hypothetical protein CFC21_067849 [Triticum aestivum]|uniref:Uncharacterized protein n=2 Tax=Triticum aestivum TaxID=4565 RepID=A0A3B6KMI1_WHEAT|nr:hypothetical protein CFC21_067849 [Triticum aestivum]
MPRRQQPPRSLAPRRRRRAHPLPRRDCRPNLLPPPPPSSGRLELTHPKLCAYVYIHMLCSAVSQDDRTFPFVLHAAAEAHAAKGQAVKLHAAALRSGHLTDVFAGNTLRLFLCGHLTDVTRAGCLMKCQSRMLSVVSAFLANKMLDDVRQALVSMTESGQRGPCECGKLGLGYACLISSCVHTTVATSFSCRGSDG